MSLLLVGARALGAAARRAGPRARPLASAVALGGETSKVPVTLLSGFLGTGKTTLLQHLLKTAAADKDTRIGVVINDMASVNIDAKLAKLSKLEDGEADGAEFVEIGDGCICCTMADELFTTLAQLAAVSAARGYRYDHIVVEATGVAEPRSIRDQFQDAAAAGVPLLDEVELDTLVTVVDAKAFLDAYGDTSSISHRPDLVATEDDPSAFLMSRFDGSLQRAVVDLLVEQVECADVLLLNKADLVDQGELARLDAVVRALNPAARVSSCEYGAADLTEVLGVAPDDGAAYVGPVDEHKAAVAAVKAAEPCEDTACTDPSHSHAARDHDHAPAAAESGHDHSHKAAEASHDHAHAAAEPCADATCTDPTHDHSHKAEAEPCADATCTDPTHDHSHASHSHAHAHGDAFGLESFGIDSFVYSARKPFAPARLQALLGDLPADVTGAFAPGADVQRGGAATEPLRGIVRSKGFLWLASSHDAAYYWSHAGAFFQAELLGRWWATLPEEHYPEDLKESILSDFAGDDGDRRQEIVFIGQDAKKNAAAISAALDACLVTDDEFEAYRASDDDQRPALFPSDLRVRA